MDKRIENTYTALQLGLRELLGETTWDKITIHQICKRAQVSRSTFYSHFTDKEDLLDSLMVMFDRALTDDKNGRSLAGNGKFRFLPILALHVSQNRNVFALSNTTMQGFPIAIRFRNLIAGRVTSELLEAGKTGTENTALADFISGGIYNALVGWSKTSKRSTHLDILERLDEIVEKYRENN